MRTLLRRFLLLSLLPVSAAYANVTPAFYFQDHAVLQAGKPLTVWGTADAGEKVTVIFSGQNVSTVAQPDGTWKLQLAPLKINATPATLSFVANNTVVVNDVLVGEVWICSGQSNMEFNVSQATNAEAEIAAANLPLIRQFRLANTASNTPVTATRANWAVANPANVGNFTAVGYFFAREVQQKLGVPVGIIKSTWGGTDIEAWISEDTITQNPALKFVPASWQKKLADYPSAKIKFDAFEAEQESKFQEAKARGEIYKKRWQAPLANPDGTPNQNKPSNLYNGMISPLTPATIAGVLWYQGENNAGRDDDYRTLFPALINHWRMAFGQGNLAFYWVQLPNFRGAPSSPDWVKMREAQSTALTLPATAQAITIDVGEVGNIHPLNKQDVGHRLAVIALDKTYHQKIVSSGPVLDKAEFGKGSAIVSFKDNGSSLVAKGTSLTGFEIAGADKVFKPATATIQGNTITISAPDIAAPVAVRYAWKNAPEAGLYNQAGLPAAPFRTDSWAY